jgi:hypothetical protein
MFNDPTPAPREWLHTKRCFAATVIAAVENLRDNSELTDFEFRDHVSTVARMADDYLHDGTMTCACPRTCLSNPQKLRWECDTSVDGRLDLWCNDCLARGIEDAVMAGDFAHVHALAGALWSRWTTADLLHQRYLSSISARRYDLDFAAIEEVQLINAILRQRSY